MKLYGVLDWSLIIMTRVYNNIFDNETELHHYGVKGMKWGVRKAIRKLSPKKPSDETVTTKKSHVSWTKELVNNNILMYIKIGINCLLGR